MMLKDLLLKYPPNLRAIREAMNESQQAFAKRFGVSQTTLHTWEVKGIPVHGSSGKLINMVLSELAKRHPNRAHEVSVE